MSDDEPRAAEPALAEVDSQEPKKLRLSLLENAYDSLNDSLNSADLAASQVRSWKLAIFLVVHALELLMKERLRREHRLLVYVNVDRPLRTVSMEGALDRLQALGVAIEPSDRRTIGKAIEWRDRIAHYDFDVFLEEAERVYAQLFEFAHSFHQKELGSDLHAHISESNWAKEAELMELFRTEFVVYNGVDVTRDWPAEIVAAQRELEVEVQGEQYRRLAYGYESGWAVNNPSYSANPCHDCAVVRGQLHVPGCDAEQCPRCEGQLISCPCEWGIEDVEAQDDAGAEPSAVVTNG